MVSTLELTDWLDKQRRGYHKHDGFPEHPVRVKHHEEYFASHTEELDQPSAETSQIDIKDIWADLQTKLSELNQKTSFSDSSSEAYTKLIQEKIDNPASVVEMIDPVIAPKLALLVDELFSEEDFSKFLETLENSYTPERASLEVERDSLRAIMDSLTEDAETREQAYLDERLIRAKIINLDAPYRYIREVFIKSRPIPVLMDNIDTLVNSDKWYMQEIVFDLMKLDPTADFLMDIFNNESLDNEVRIKALGSFDAKRFNEQMIEWHGDDWETATEWSSHPDNEYGRKMLEVRGLNRVFGRDAVNHFVEHLEFPDDAQFDITDTFNVSRKDPGEKPRKMFADLYSNTKFGKLHKISMEHWEASSSSDWGGLLKESVGRQFDGDVVYHDGVNNVDENIDKLKEEYLSSELTSYRLKNIMDIHEAILSPESMGGIGYNQTVLDYKTAPDNLDEYVRTHKKAIRKILDAVYKDQDYIPVYRGTKGSEELGEAPTIEEEIGYTPASQEIFDIIHSRFPSMKTDAFRFMSDDSTDMEWSKMIMETFERAYDKDEKWANNVDSWGEDGKKLVEWFSNQGQPIRNWTSIDVNANPLSSYSLNSHTANKFAQENNGWIISSLVHKDDIWSNFWSHSYDGNEREFLIINKERESVGIRAENYKNLSEQSLRDSPLTENFDTYGFPAEKGEHEWVFDSKQQDMVDNITSKLESPKDVSTDEFYTIDDHYKNFSTLHTYLNKFVEDDGMPPYKALDIWNSATQNAGWKKNPLLGEDKHRLVRFANEIREWRKIFEDKIGSGAEGFSKELTKSEWISKQVSSGRTMLVPYRTMVNRHGKSPYFATRWKKVTVPQRTGTTYNVIPIEEYKGDIKNIYSSWQGYVGDKEEGRHDLFLPIIALQEILYKGFDGLLAVFNNRIVGVVSLHINQADEARLSILSASPFDIVQGTENRIEDMLRRGVEIYVKNKGWDYVGIDKHQHIDHEHTQRDAEDIELEKARGQLIPVKVPITLPSGEKTEGIRWKKGKSDEKAFADFDDVFDALKDDPKMKEYLELVAKKVPATWKRETLELDMNSENNVIARAINSFGKWSYIRSTEKDGEIEEAKHEKVGKFTKSISKIREGIEGGVKKGDEEAIILHLIDVAGLRIGDEPDSGEAFDRTQPKGEDGNFPRVPTYAARQLLGKHVSVDGTKVRLQYPAKDNVPIDKTIDNAQLAKFFSDKKKTVGDEDKLFEPTASKVRSYLQKLGKGNDFKVHNFRHYHATRLIIDRLKEYPLPTVDSKDISRAVRTAEIKQFKEGGRSKLSQVDRKNIVEDYVAKQFRKHQLVVAETSAEFLAHTPAMSLEKYIMPHVWSEWEKEQTKIVREHLSNPEPEPQKVRKIKRTKKVTKQDDNFDDYETWEDIDDFFERTAYDEESTLDDDSDIFPEDEEEREAEESSDEGWQYPIDLSKSTASVAEAKRRGLVPQSGDWQKPRRWVRPKDTEETSTLTKLPEDMWKYFDEVPNTILVDVSKLSSSKDIHDPINRKPIENANRFMELAYRGEIDKRKPLDLKDNGDGTYEVLDGNSTYANALNSEWEKLPGIVIEKPRKKASVLDGVKSLDKKTIQKNIDGMKAVFGDDFDISNFQDMYSIGLDDYSTNILELDGSDDGKDASYKGGFVAIEVEITDDTTYPLPPLVIGHIDRTFTREKDGILSVSHNSFVIEEDYQGLGIASDIAENVEKHYEKLGVDNITLNANAKIGGYAWARQGYDFEFDYDRERTEQRFIVILGYLYNDAGVFDKREYDGYVDEIKSFKHSWEFASWNPSYREKDSENLGKTLLLGEQWDGVKSLNKKSIGYQIGKAYFAAKRNTSIKG